MSKVSGPMCSSGASNKASILLPLSNLVLKHIVMAQSETEGPNKKKRFLSLKFGLKLDNVH